MIQVIQIVGALMILAAFGADQFKLIKSSSVLYLTLNFVGSAILSVVAFIEGQWGFVMLEVVWALISLWKLFQAMTGREVGES